MNRMILAIATVAALAIPAAAQQHEYYKLREAAKKSGLTAAELAARDASNHGYATAALETLCSDVLVVTDPKLRADWDRKYRDNPRYLKQYNEGYAFVAKEAEDIRVNRLNSKRYSRCIGGATAAPWLTFKSGGEELLKSNAQEEKSSLAKAPLGVQTPTSGNTNARDKQDEEFINKTAPAYYTATVLISPSVCDIKLSNSMQAVVQKRAAEAGEKLLLEQIKMTANILEERGRAYWCGMAADFVKMIESQITK